MGIKRVKVVVFLIVAVLAVFATPVIYAAPPAAAVGQKEEFIEKMENKRQEIYNELALSDEQRKLLEENKNKHKEQTKALFTQMRRKMSLLRQELEKSELDTQKIYQTNNELKQLQAQMLDSRLERILEVRKILTPAQFKKFEDRMNEHMAYFKNKRERNEKEF